MPAPRERPTAGAPRLRGRPDARVTGRGRVRHRPRGGRGAVRTAGRPAGQAARSGRPACLYGLRPAEVAKALGTSRAAVEGLLFRGRRQLRRRLRPGVAAGVLVVPLAIQESIAYAVPGFASSRRARGLGRHRHAERSSRSTDSARDAACDNGGQTGRTDGGRVHHASSDEPATARAVAAGSRGRLPRRSALERPPQLGPRPLGAWERRRAGSVPGAGRPRGRQRARRRTRAGTREQLGPRQGRRHSPSRRTAATAAAETAAAATMTTAGTAGARTRQTDRRPPAPPAGPPPRDLEVARAGLEPATPRFSAVCSTN